MAAFAIYNFSFHEVKNVGMFLGQEDDTTPLPTPKDKQDFIQKIFHDDLNGGRQFECCLLESTTSSGERNKERVLYGSKVYGRIRVWLYS